MCLNPLDQKSNRKKARLILEDGIEFEGYCFGKNISTAGEIVFQTGMVGYGESLTDPSYHIQILVLTYPLIGNYGVPAGPLSSWAESHRIWAAGLVVDEACVQPSHWNSGRNLASWMEEEGIPGIQGIDTRALTKLIREKGTMLGKIVVEGDQEGEVSLFNPNINNLVAEVSTKTAKTFNETGTPRICAVDCGLKMNQIRCLTKRGARVDVVPWDTKLDPQQYDALFLSNGPGDPQICKQTVEEIKRVISMPNPKPVFGICLGHQLMALAAGCTTYKLKV
jgi:carbamoyl-phosphate synthase/aspartate carbamoyltransferase/dihydroorotase